MARAFPSNLPSYNDRAAANRLSEIMATLAEDSGTVVPYMDPATKTLEKVILSPALADIFVSLLRHIGRGEAVTLVPIAQMLTTQQAADILNVSRPYLIKLLDQKLIAHEKVGRHRRIRAEDVFRYKNERDTRRSKALDALMSGDADLI
jgi:excisionase family DNA binding protein